jgi:HTH-type transcriptional repressor of NAD biosynthesis genes
MNWAWSNRMKSTSRSPNEGAGLTSSTKASRTRRVAVLGAQKTGKTWLAHALASALPDCHIADSPPLLNAVLGHWRFNDASLYPKALAQHTQFEVTLLMGLDGAWLSEAPNGKAEGQAKVQAQGQVKVQAQAGAQAEVQAHVQAGALALTQRNQIDTLLRQALDQAGCRYHVVYGQGSQRLNNALLALGLPSLDPTAHELREQSQFAIHRGRTVWQCNACSDPDCEHQLFTGLLAQR